MLYLFLLVALLIPLMAVILDSRLGQALAARLERDAKSVGPEEAGRLAALEGDVERLSEEVRRLREQGEFLEHLVAERKTAQLGPGEASRNPRAESGDATNPSVRPDSE